jgi:hypothetical protein
METFRDRCRRVVEIIDEVEQADGRPPTGEEVAERSGWSVEYTYFILHRMAEHGALVVIPSSYEDRYAVEDEDRVASVPDPDDEPSVTDAERDRRQKLDEQVRDIGRRFDKGFVDEQRSKLFGDLGERLAGKTVARANPLDGPAPAADPAAPPEQKDFFAELSRQLSGKTEKKVNPLDALTGKKDK